MMVMDTHVKPVEILLVEDNPVDILITRQALQDGRVYNRVHVAEDGEEATDFLRREGKFADAPRPDIVLLDLNLPKKSGMEVLAEMRTDDDLGLIPVVVLTTSEAEGDILKSYQLHANCFITKPVDMEQFTEVIKKIEGFWFTIVKLPAHGDS